jgi:hypothetical protein
MAVAHCSWKGNEQHNPGEPVYWNRAKSTDEHDALMRHLLEVGKIDTDGVRHSTKVAWRALAALEKELEAVDVDRTERGGCIADWGPGEEQAWMERVRTGKKPTTESLLDDLFGKGNWIAAEELQKEKAPSHKEKEPVQLRLPFDDYDDARRQEDRSLRAQQQEWFYGMREAYAPRETAPTPPAQPEYTSERDTASGLSPKCTPRPGSLPRHPDGGGSPGSGLLPRSAEAPPASTPEDRCERPATSPAPVPEEWLPGGGYDPDR